MIRKTSIVAAIVLGAASFTFAAGNARTVYVGGHTGFNDVRTEAKAPAPYALTGTEQTPKENLTRNIWVGSRFVAATVVQR